VINSIVLNQTPLSSMWQ